MVINKWLKRNLNVKKAKKKKKKKHRGRENRANNNSTRIALKSGFLIMIATSSYINSMLNAI